MKSALVAPAAAALLATLLGCLAPAPRGQGAQLSTATVPDPDDAMAALLREFATDESELERWLSVRPDPGRAARLDQLAADWRTRLDGIDPEPLGVEGRIDRLLLLGHLAHGERSRATERARGERLDHALPFADALIELELARWSLSPFDPSEVAGRLAALADEAAALADEPPEVGASDALWLARRVDELAEALATWRRHHQDYDPGFGWWTDAPADRLAQALGDYAEALRTERADVHGEPDDPLVGDPIGRDALLADLSHEWIAYTPEELLAIGREQLAWCEARLAEAAAELGHGDDWKAALEQVKGMHVQPGEQDDLVLAFGREAVDWLDARELVTIPALCRETWRVRMLSKDAQRSLPFAAYGGQHMLVAFPTADMPHDAKRQAMRGNNRPFTRAVTPHELIPGHHLQGYMAARHATQRRPFATPFLGEGWALHWELLMYEAGWPRSPEERIGMLFWRCHRAARIVFSLGFHLGELSAAEAVDLLLERVGHERDNATAEVRRSIGGDYSPLYQCAYLVGALQMQALYHELVRDGTMTPRAFHDAVLASGPIPVELIRARLRGERLPVDAAPRWRFAGDLLAEGR